LLDRKLSAEFSWRWKKAQVSHSVEVLGSQTGIPKGSKKKITNSKGHKGLMILEFGRHGG